MRRTRKAKVPDPAQGAGRACAAKTFALLVSPMTEVTHILSSIEQGDPSAAEQLLPLVYEELRRLAAQRLAQEKPGHTLQPTALVKLRYFAGLSHQEAAEALGIGRRAADRLWALARAWLYQRLSEE